MVKFKKGKWYLVEFWDHVCGADKVVKCRIFGYMIKEDKLSVTLSWWDCMDGDFKDDNQEHVTLLKSTLCRVSPVPRQFLER